MLSRKLVPIWLIFISLPFFELFILKPTIFESRCQNQLTILFLFFVAIFITRSVSIIQDDTLNGDAASVDISTVENLDILAKIGDELLKKPVSRVNLESGCNENAYEVTNEKALIKYEI